MRILRIPFSTNVERVALAAGDEGEVVVDSMRIVAWLEARRPAPPLWPADPARRAEVDIFVEWFDRVWKVPPNRIEEELGAHAPDHVLVEALAAEMRGSLTLFEAMLDGRTHLMGDELSAADCAAFPFLKYGLWLRDDDDERFHRILAEYLSLDSAYPRLEDWLRRVDERPRIAGVVVHPAHG